MVVVIAIAIAIVVIETGFAKRVVIVVVDATTVVIVVAGGIEELRRVAVEIGLDVFVCCQEVGRVEGVECAVEAVLAQEPGSESCTAG